VTVLAPIQAHLCPLLGTEPIAGNVGIARKAPPTNGRRRVMVEVAGIEPASDSENPGLLRAQYCFAFLGPSAHADKALTGSVTEESPPPR